MLISSDGKISMNLKIEDAIKGNLVVNNAEKYTEEMATFEIPVSDFMEQTNSITSTLYVKDNEIK